MNASASFGWGYGVEGLCDFKNDFELPYLPGEADVFMTSRTELHDSTIHWSSFPCESWNITKGFFT